MAIFGCCFGTAPSQTIYHHTGRMVVEADGTSYPSLRRVSENTPETRHTLPPLPRPRHPGEAPAPTPLYRRVSEQYPEAPRPKLPPLTRRLERPGEPPAAASLPYRRIPERDPIESQIHDTQIKVTDAYNLLTEEQKKLLLERMQEVHTFFYDKFGIEAVSPEEIFPPINSGKEEPNNAEWSNDVKKGWKFGSKSISLETVAHEYIHAIVQRLTKLNSKGEEGALNESLADVFASIFKQYKAGHSVEKADWQLTDEGEMYRSVKAFSTGIKYPKLTGEEHDDAAIPNYAFYTAAMAIGGNSWETIGKIWCEAMKNIKGLRDSISLPPLLSFSRATIAATNKLFPKKEFPKHEQFISEAWAKVGIDLNLSLYYPRVE